MCNLIKQIEALCQQNNETPNSIKIDNTIQKAMQENGDTALVAVIVKDEAWRNDRNAFDVLFYAYSEKYIYFLDIEIIPFSEGEVSAGISSLPRHPEDVVVKDIFYTGGYQ